MRKILVIGTMLVFVLYYISSKNPAFGYLLFIVVLTLAIVGIIVLLLYLIFSK